MCRRRSTPCERTCARCSASSPWPTARHRWPIPPLPCPPQPGPIEAAGLRVRYGTGLPLALDGLDVRVEPGTRVAVVGRSGAGKTTLALALLRFAGIDSGTLALDGHDVAAYSQADVRNIVGLLAQEAHIFNTTVGANIRLARLAATDEDVMDACDRAGLSPWLGSLPGGLDTRVGSGGALVSGGEGQRIALARALLAGRPILVLDEPTANLDPETGREVIDGLLAATRDETVVLITHDLTAAARAVKIVVIEAGARQSTGRMKRCSPSEGPMPACGACRRTPEGRSWSRVYARLTPDLGRAHLRRFGASPLRMPYEDTDGRRPRCPLGLSHGADT